VSFFFTAFTTLFVIVDPPGNIPMFIALTERLEKNLVDRISKKAVTIASSILIIFTFGGYAIIEFFKISIESLKVAGGLLLFIISVDILLGRRTREYYLQKGLESLDVDSIAVFPLALPLYTGPGAITATIVLSSEADIIGKLILVLAILLVYFIVRLTHIYSQFIISLLGKSGSDIIARVMAIFLASIGVEYIFEGTLSLVG